MTTAEENKLHNLFIKLKNEGKDDASIQKELGLDEGLFKRWNESYEQTSEQLKNNYPTNLKVTINGVNLLGAYEYNSSLHIRMTLLQGAIFTLENIVASEVKSDFEKRQKAKAKKFLPIFQNYFLDLAIDLPQSKVTFKINTDDKKISLLARNAAKFYSQIYYDERRYWQGMLINESTQSIFSNPMKILEYALKQLKIKNFQGVHAAGIAGIPVDKQWIFLIGENGYGKSTILQAICIGLFGKDDEGVPLVEVSFDRGMISAEYISLGHDKINNISVARFEKLEHLACYGPSRLQIQSDQTQNDIAKKSTTTYSLFNSDGILLNIEFELLIWFLEKNPRFEAVKKTFLQLIPYLADIQVDVANRKVLYIEKEPNESGGSYNPVTFNQLASGFRSIIAMVGDMMIRLFKSQPTITNPAELSGIVIIDELDLHWHPKMQREIPNLLSSIFPKVQFIASTHSLVPLLGAPESSVLLKVNRTVEEGITVQRVNIDFAALSTDVILRDIFDLEKYMSDAKIKAWERHVELKGLIHFEKNDEKKQAYWDEYEQLGDKFQFEL